MNVKCNTQYPLRRAEVKACRTAAARSSVSMKRAMSGWAFCMLTGVSNGSACSTVIQADSGVTYGLVVVDSMWQDLVLPISIVPAVDWLVLMSIHDQRWPRLRLGPLTPGGDDLLTTVTPNDNDWVVTLRGVVRRSEFVSKGEQLDDHGFPLGYSYVNAAKQMVTPFRGKCTQRLWRAERLNDLQ